MTSLPEQLSAARKSQFEAQLDLIRTLTAQAVDSAAQVIALNLNTSRTSVEQSSNVVRQLLATTDPRDLLSLGTHTQQQLQTMLTYGRELFGIASGARVNLSRQLNAPAAAPVPSAPQAVAPQAMPQAAAPQVVQQAAAPEAMPQAVAPKAPVPVVMPQAAAPVAAAPAAAPAVAEQAPAAVAQPEAEAPAETKGVKPSRKPLGMADREAAPEPVAKAKPIANAAGKVAASPAMTQHPVASPFSADGGHDIEIPRIKPVEASPPTSPGAGKPAISNQPTQPGTKPRRKK
jgi:phasin family protein